MILLHMRRHFFKFLPIFLSLHVLFNEPLPHFLNVYLIIISIFLLHQTALYRLLSCPQTLEKTWFHSLLVLLCWFLRIFTRGWRNCILLISFSGFCPLFFFFCFLGPIFGYDELRLIRHGTGSSDKVAYKWKRLRSQLLGRGTTRSPLYNMSVRVSGFHKYFFFQFPLFHSCVLHHTQPLSHSFLLSYSLVDQLSVTISRSSDWVGVVLCSMLCFCDNGCLCFFLFSFFFSPFHVLSHTLWLFLCLPFVAVS